METLRKLTYDLLELRYKIPTDDNVVTKRQVESWIRQQRAIWVSNELNKNRFEPIYWQKTGKFSLVPHSEWGSDFKTIDEIIPPLIQVNHRPAIIEINNGSPIGKKFPYLYYQDMRYMGTRNFDASTIFAYLIDDKIVLKRPPDDTLGEFDSLTHVNVIGVFEDPMDLKIFNKPDGSPVYHEDLSYPIHLKLYTYMREQILKTNFPVEVQSTQDVLNDGKAQD